jgi:LysR family cys regulon transcriptional activator
MNLQQLRYVVEVARRDLNVSEAAAALFTSQPGVSKQIRLLEDELGVSIFVRHGKRLVGLTEPGREILGIAERVLGDLGNLRQVGEEFGNENQGRLSIATTHTQARYALPRAVVAFRQRYPQVRLELHQGSPEQVAEAVLAGDADLAVATESIAERHELVTLPCYQWNRSVIAPPGHALLTAEPLSLEAIAAWPLITYDSAFTGRSQINKAFAARGVRPNVVLTALDADIIKTYVRLGLGVGIVASMAFDPANDQGLAARDCAHLFESSTTRIGLKRSAWHRAYVFAFIELFAPHLTRHAVELALRGGGEDPQL